MAKTPAELILGTAQFGLDYGVTNRHGRPDDGTLDSILRAASPDIGWLDTSIKYGDALDRLGRPAAAPFSIVTKIQGTDAAGAIQEIDETLRRLNRPRLDAVLLHDPAIFDDRARAADVVAALQGEVARGRISHIGASLYDAPGVDAALATFTPDILQLPASIADNRLLAGGTLHHIHAAGIAVHFRSAFLQGLLLSDPNTLSAHFGVLAPLLRQLDDLAEEYAVTRQELCLNWVMNLPGAAGLVCGISSQAELTALVAAHRAAAALDTGSRLDEIAAATRLDRAIVDPREWPRSP